MAVPARMGRKEYYLNMAHSAALRGDCRRRQVGAIVVWEDRIWATGYNGTLTRSQPGCLDGACPRGEKTYEERPAYSNYDDCIAAHAEQNAISQFSAFWILQTNWPREMSLPAVWATTLGSPVDLYVSEIPCDDCAVFIMKTGITEVYWPGGQFEGRWPNGKGQ